jgi:dTDP-4-dehydrorhamnose 3,5-epimerase-like enzyme
VTRSEIVNAQKWSVERLRRFTDSRGSLVSIEAGEDAGFPIKRVYYLYGTPRGVERGFHAHRTLEQLIVAVSGSCTLVLDDGRTREELRLDDPDRGLRVGAMVWREMRDFSPDCVLLVLASQPFDESDYIRAYDDFVREVGARQP